jgi:signal transduction histidine kinase
MAGIEAFVDRKLEPTDARLSGILHALHEVDALIDDIPRERTIEFETRVQPMNICALIHSEAQAMEGYALGHGVQLRVHRCGAAHAGCERFFGDPKRIGEVVTNVLTNAIRYTGPGGAVDVDCRREGPDLCFSVADQGPGVADDERAKIFERGYRGAAASNIPGSGTGLALVKEFVERHGGRVLVENRAQRGATFTVRLPTSAGVCTVCPGQNGSRATDVLRGDCDFGNADYP